MLIARAAWCSFARPPVVELLPHLEIEEDLRRHYAVERAHPVREIEELAPVGGDDLDDEVELTRGRRRRSRSAASARARRRPRSGGPDVLMPTSACSKPSPSGFVTATTCRIPSLVRRAYRARTVASETPSRAAIRRNDSRPFSWSASMIPRSSSSTRRAGRDRPARASARAVETERLTLGTAQRVEFVPLMLRIASISLTSAAEMRDRRGNRSTRRATVARTPLLRAFQRLAEEHRTAERLGIPPAELRGRSAGEHLHARRFPEARGRRRRRGGDRRAARVRAARARQQLAERAAHRDRRRRHRRAERRTEARRQGRRVDDLRGVDRSRRRPDAHGRLGLLGRTARSRSSAAS